ncbi:MAG: hypothetical protein RMJ33_13785, partial [Saprospiraceae bacterium]|nr:hypothetical protein [Saprospiraceae bacterium]
VVVAGVVLQGEVSFCHENPGGLEEWLGKETKKYASCVYFPPQYWGEACAGVRSLRLIQSGFEGPVES